jgi:hypothetical protein
MDRRIAVGQYRLDLAFAISARTPAECLVKMGAFGDSGK